MVLSIITSGVIASPERKRVTAWRVTAAVSDGTSIPAQSDQFGPASLVAVAQAALGEEAPTLHGITPQPIDPNTVPAAAV